MALSGIEIYKLLPKTNCKDCEFPTCLAFAMKLAAKQVELSACPHVSEESQIQLAASSEPPIRLVSVKSNGYEVKAGNEVVLFRHEKTFYNMPGLFVRVTDEMTAKQIQEKLAKDLEARGILIENVLLRNVALPSNLANAIQEKLDVLSKYGGIFVSIRDNFEWDRKQLSYLKSKYAEAKIDAEKSLEHKFVVNNAQPAEKKSYPIRWLIVVTSKLGAFLMSIFLIITLQSLKSLGLKDKASKAVQSSEK